MNRLQSLFCFSAFLCCTLVASCLLAQTPKTITNSIGIKLVLIPKGTFMMGSPGSEIGPENKQTQHEVTISKDYYLGVTEVTQGQYEKVMGTNPSFFQGDKVAERNPDTDRVIKEVDSSNHPVEQVSWGDAIDFCKKLSDLPGEKAAGRVYRLPTEAQWEYACRAGSKSAYSFGESSKSLGDYAWFAGKSNGQTHPVGEKKATAWGLYDMQGNVFEWCSDWYDEYPKGAVSDPTGPKEGSLRVFRGGCWDGVAELCKSADRAWGLPSSRIYGIGFRVALSSSGIPK
jgi:formylglycine-generating enzyme required for sulfatase activity